MPYGIIGMLNVLKLKIVCKKSNIINMQVFGQVSCRFYNIIIL